jgi:hypothetical protein
MLTFTVVLCGWKDNREITERRWWGDGNWRGMGTGDSMPGV